MQNNITKDSILNNTISLSSNNKVEIIGNEVLLSVSGLDHLNKELELINQRYNQLQIDVIANLISPNIKDGTKQLILNELVTSLKVIGDLELVISKIISDYNLHKQSAKLLSSQKRKGELNNLKELRQLSDVMTRELRKASSKLAETASCIDEFL